MPTNRRSKKDRRSISVMFRSFFSRSNSRKNESSGKASDSGVANKRIYDKNKKVDFGIDDTEKLKHFSKPKPPQNRRPPRASATRRARAPLSSSTSSSGIATARGPITETDAPRNNGQEERSKPEDRFHRGLYLSHSQLAGIRQDQEAIVQQRKQATSDSVLISKSVPNLLQDSNDSDDLSDILDENPGDHESKKRSSLWRIFQRTSRKSTASSLEDDDHECTCQDHSCGDHEDEDSSEQEERSLETPENELDDERFISMVERRVKPPIMPHSATFVDDRSASGGHYIQHRHSTPYTSYQEFIRVTHKSMPAKVAMS